METSREESDNWNIGSAYTRNTGYLAFRLSELVFGSLIASYILGFIAKAMSIKDAISPKFNFFTEVRIVDMNSILNSPWTSYLISLCAVIFVSVTYSFLTTFIYYRYHNVVLKNPAKHGPSTNGDFVLALSIAISFGVSLIHVNFYPFIFLGICLYLANRNRKLCQSTLYDLYLEVVPKQHRPQSENNDSLKRLLTNIRADILNGSYPKISHYFDSRYYNLSLIVALISLLALVLFLIRRWLGALSSIEQNMILGLFSIGFSICVIIYVSKGLRRSNVKVGNQVPDFDDEQKELDEMLKELKDTYSRRR